MIIAASSDFHGMLPPPEAFAGADVVLLAGDLCRDSYQDNWLRNEFRQWANAITAPIHLTWGNHDQPTQTQFALADLPAHVQVHVDEAVTIGNERVWFSPWSRVYGTWPWMASEPKLSMLYAGMPHDTTIIVSHTPPLDACDRETYRGTHVGSHALSGAILARPSVRLVVCGHIHEGFGLGRCHHAEVLNVSYVDAKYQPVNDVVFVEVQPDDREISSADAAVRSADR